MKSLSTVVKDSRHAAFRHLALRRGLSVNQYLKFLVLRELGENPPEGLNQFELTLWLRGK